MKQEAQEKLMTLIKSNLREIIFGVNSDSYSVYVARLTLDKIIAYEKELANDPK